MEHDPRANFKVLFYADDKAPLKDASLKGKLQASGVRSISWRYFLQCFPENTNPSQWLAPTTVARKKYDAQIKEYIIDPRALEDESRLDPSINNPLSQAEESPWAKFFQNAELEKTIKQDLERCYPENEFFTQRSVQEQMLRILFVWAREHPALLYKQGMHELLAPMIYLLNQEYKPRPEVPEDTPEGQVFWALTDRAYLEHDAYIIFTALMESTAPWFMGGGTPVQKRPTGALLTTESSEETVPTSAIVSKCRRIQNLILRSKDAELFAHLESLKIEPQLYLLRWIRLLLGREFHLDDVLLLWDAIFAYSSDLVLIDHLCVAMLIFIRTQLLERDYSGCLTRLFRYPPVEDITIFIEQALNLINPVLYPKRIPATPVVAGSVAGSAAGGAAAPLGGVPIDDPLSVGSVTAATTAATTTTSSAHSGSTPSTSSTAASRHTPLLSSSTSSSSASPFGGVSVSHGDSKKKQQTHKESKQMVAIDHSPSSEEDFLGAMSSANLRDLQRNLGAKLDTIIHSLQKDLQEHPNLINFGNLAMNLAELKQVRDIMCGLLPPPTPENSSPEEDPEDRDKFDDPLGAASLN